jgi:multimeric flavodoxin WrbA
MATILITYHSQSGNTEQMALAVAKGAREIAGTTVIINRAFDTRVEDLIACDGLVIGSPEYFGYMAGAVKDLFDRTYEVLRGHQRIFRKPVAMFVSAGNDGSGALRNLERMCIGYQFKKVHEAIVSKGPITDATLSHCEELGRIMAAGCGTDIF